MYFIGLLIMTGGEVGGVSSIMELLGGGLDTAVPCVSQKSGRTHLKHPHRELAHPRLGQGTWQRADHHRAPQTQTLLGFWIPAPQLGVHLPVAQLGK